MTTNFPSGLESRGAPVLTAMGGVPHIGTTWWVDATNGLDSNDGLSHDHAKQTIQAAVTAQSADRSGFNDIIYILPGTYAESITVTLLQDCSIIGASADSVIIAPTSGHAMLVGVDDANSGSPSVSMNRSVIKNITFLTPTGGSAILAALCMTYATKSVVEDCMFKGTTTTGYQPTETVGIQYGSPTASAWEFPEFNRISRCEFSANGGRVQELGIGIRVGPHTNTTPAYRGFKSNIIEDCIISAYDTGILCNYGMSSGNATVIRRNVITSMQGGHGPDMGIISQADDGVDSMTMILWNNIASISDCIKNFSPCNTMGNVVSLGSTPVDETMCD